MTTIQEFSEQYNRLIDWDMEVLNSIDEKLRSNPTIKDIIDECFEEREKITEDTCDFSDYKIYDFPENMKELEVFNNTECHRMYYWVTFGYTEDEYKKKKIEELSSSLYHRMKELRSQIKYFESRRKIMDELLYSLSHIES
jgi:DNA-binding transcriptional regulator GbsR (MarR family)